MGLHNIVNNTKEGILNSYKSIEGLYKKIPKGKNLLYIPLAALVLDATVDAAEFGTKSDKVPYKVSQKQGEISNAVSGFSFNFPDYTFIGKKEGIVESESEIKKIDNTYTYTITFKDGSKSTIGGNKEDIGYMKEYIKKRDKVKIDYSEKNENFVFDGRITIERKITEEYSKKLLELQPEKKISRTRMHF
ncbi:hypothetical protein CL615_04480 [archaeon]|jgi:hypothetical protein|nr:hypothetical protein [archaeon]|tara:strand:+ start:285 stop:854 length:570 start_codon:yes stop_codon:yes gene_type:complete